MDDVADIRWLLRAALNADGRFNVVSEAAVAAAAQDAGVVGFVKKGAAPKAIADAVALAAS